MTLALPAVFAACTNDAIEGDVQQNGGRELLSKDFSIVASKTMDAESRGQWFKEGTYKFNWKNSTAADKIGLCWTGSATAADGSDVSVANPNNMALSNYEFVLTHYTNGKSGDDYAESPYATEKVSYANGTTYNNYQTAKFAVTGVTPFTGKYVMYYPYSPALKNVGYLPVSVPANQTMAATIGAQLEEFGAMTLCISEPYTFDSSTSTTDVEMLPYTTGFLPRMIKSDATGATDVTVKRIMLVAADGKNIVNEQTLDLDGTVKTSKGVTVMTLTLPDAFTVNSTDVNAAKEALMAVLPQTLKLGEFELLFVNASSKAYSYPLTKDLTFKAGIVYAPTVTLDGRNFTLDIISDETALTAAINGATQSTKTVSTYKNVPVTFASDAEFTNAEKVTVNAEKIIFNGEVEFGGDIEFTCPVEFNDAVTVGEGVTVTLADGSVLNSTIALTAGADADHITTLNLKATTIKNALSVDATNAAINFTSGTSELNAVFTVGANQTVNVKNGATVNVNVATGLTNNGTVNVEQGGALVVAAKYTPAGGSEIVPTIANAANLNVNGTLTNNSVINNTATLKTDGNGVINNNLTINNSGNIVLMQSEGVALSQGTGATVEDGGNISGISRISGGDVVVKIDAINTLEAALANLKYNNHTAFRITTAQTVGTLVNTTKKLILAANLTLNGASSETADNATGSIEILNDATITSVDKLNVTGDITIAASKTLTVATGTNISVSGKIYNNGTFYIATPADSYVYCNGIVTGTGATWNPTPQW